LQLIIWLAFAYGALLGSFANVVAYRLPRRMSVVRPGSHCPVCESALGPLELIPILSWLLLGGRCRHCNTAIPLRYPLFELVSGALCAWSVAVMPNWPVRIAWCVFWLFLMTIVETDLMYWVVSDKLSLPGIAVFLLLSPICGVQSPAHAVLGAGLCTAALFALFFISRGNMGLGDVKLYASVGAMLGPVQGIESLIFASGFGTLLGLGLRAAGIMRPRERLPFVPYIAMGVIAAVLFGHPLAAWYLRTVLGAGV
jgi:prepilin signal peptidase PulO-like enzyme (type II secretory pathway)